MFWNLNNSDACSSWADEQWFIKMPEPNHHSVAKREVLSENTIALNYAFFVWWASLMVSASWMSNAIFGANSAFAFVLASNDLEMWASERKWRAHNLWGITCKSHVHSTNRVKTLHWEGHSLNGIHWMASTEWHPLNSILSPFAFPNRDQAQSVRRR